MRVLFWKAAPEVLSAIKAVVAGAEMVSPCLSASGAGFLFYPRRRGEEERKKNQSFKAWGHKDTEWTQDEWWFNKKKKKREKTLGTNHGHKGAQSLSFRGKWLMFLLIGGKNASQPSNQPTTCWREQPLVPPTDTEANANVGCCFLLFLRLSRC